MNKIYDHIRDKFYRFLLLFETSTKKEDDYNYSRDFLGEADYWKDLAEIFKPVTELTNNDFYKIYSIKETLYSETVLDKIRYTIKNKFWGIFAFTRMDGIRMSNSDYFNNPSIRVYLIINHNNDKLIAVVKSKVRHFEVLDWYPKIKSNLNSFKEKKLVYCKEKKFISL